MITDALIIGATFAIGGLIGFSAGVLRGNKRGRDEQWVESFLAGEKREKARRDKSGRFKTKPKNK